MAGYHDPTHKFMKKKHTLTDNTNICMFHEDSYKSLTFWQEANAISLKSLKLS